MKKPWYQSRTMWAGVIIAGYGISVAIGLPVEQYKEAIIALASGLGLVGIRGALPDKKK